MMRKLPKQHLLGLALTLVGVGAFLGIQISDVANQQTYASWASNDDIIDDVFRAGTPSNATIINALFGDGNGNTDETFYTHHWSGNSCNIGAMSVVNLSPGTNTIPISLSANTVYVLDVGVYNMTTGPISFNGDCIALVGKRTSMIYNTGAAHITSNGQSLDITNRSNVVVASIIQETSVTGNNIGIDIENSTNSTVWPIDVMAWDEGIYMENSSFVFVGGNASANRLGIGVQNNSANIYVGEIGLDNITSLTNNDIGIDIDDSDNVFMYNAVSNTNVYLGGIVENSSNIVVNGSTFNANSAGFGFAGLRLSGSQNITLSGGSYDANDGAGIWAQNVAGLTGNGLSIRSNIGGTGYGMYLENVSNISLANMTAASNVRTNVHVTGAQNISFTNLTSTGSAEDGIQTINTTNLSILGGSFNQNTYHGIFLDAGTSGAMIDNVIANVNTLAGMYIANGANYNIVTSSTVSQNGQNGIMIYESNNNSISGSTVTDTVTSAGITLYGTSSYNNTVAHTTVAQTVAGPGIVMVGGNNNLITHSIAYENNGVGMGIAGMGLSQNDSYNNTIAYSTSYNNIGYGGFGLSLDQVNNTLHDLYAYGNDTDGITIYTAGTGVNYVHDVYTYGNLDNGLYIQESENISGYNIHTYSNEMNGVRLSNTANHNYLSFVEAYDNGLNGIEVSDSATNLFENIVSFDNTNEGIYLVLKADNNTFRDLQLYNNRIGFRQSSASANKAMISNALVYNNNGAGVALAGASVVNNAAIYNNNTGLSFQGSSNVANNVDVYNNQYGVYMAPGAMAASGKLDNVTVYNNTVGITATSSLGNTYNGLHMFDNDTPFVGTNGSDGQLTSAVPSWSMSLANNLNDTGFMTCNWAVQSTNNIAQNLLVYPYCDTRGQIGGWTPTLAVKYTFFPYIYKQQQPVGYTGVIIIATGTAITDMFVGDFAYVGSTDFGGHMNLTNEGTTFASGGFTYRYDNGPFDIEMNANTGTTKGFVVTGVNDIAWDGVAGSIGSFAGLSYPLVSQYLVPLNGLKIFRAGYDIAGQGLISNYYGQIRGVAAPVCGDTLVEGSEQCDDGNTNDNDGCNSTCQIEERDCSWFSGRTSTGFTPHNVTLSIVSGLSLAPYTFDVIVWGDSSPDGNINTGNTHTYITGGSYTGSIQVSTQFSLVSSSTKTCYFPVTAIDPTYCGDGITQTPNGSGFIEECDDANANDYDICTNTCTLYDPVCSISSTPTTGEAPLVVALSGNGGTGMLFQYFDYGNGTTGTNTGYTYLTPGTYTITGYETNQYSGVLTNQCSTQVVVSAPSVDPCTLLIQPGFVISDYQTTPYQATGEILQTITFTSTTTSANPIVTYQWDITSSGDLFGNGGYDSYPSPYIFDNALISGANDQSTVELDFSAYSGVTNWPWMRIMLTVTDSSGYQAEYQTPLLISDVTATGARYWTMGQTIIDSDFSGFALSITGEMLSSIAMSGGVVSGNNFMRPDTPIGMPHPVNIDRESNGSNEELFMYAGQYAYTNTYSTGLYTALLGTNIGSTGQYFNLSHKTYPVACSVSCGNTNIELNEQCDDGNLNNNDGCSDVCLLEIAPICGDGLVNQPSEQCDDANNDDFDGCDTQCQTNACATSYQTILEPKFAFIATGWTGDENIDINFVSTTVGSGLTYNWSIGQFSGYNGITGFNLSGWNISGATNTSTFGLHLDLITAPYTVQGTIRLDVSNGLHTGSVQGYLICTNDMINNTYPGCSIYSAYQEAQSFSGLTLTLDDRSIVQVLSRTGATQTINQYPEVGFNNLIPKRWYRSHPMMTPFTSLTGAYASGSHMYASGYGVVKPYFTRGLTYLTEPDLRKDYAYQQSVFGYTNSCFSECGNGIIENTSGYTTSGTIDYVISSSIAMLTGYDAYDDTYLTGWISVYGATLSTGTAVSYQWTFSGFSTGGANTGFIVGSSTGSTVSIFDDAYGVDSDLEGTLTLEITDAEGNIISTQSYLILDFDTVAIVGMGVGTITISGSQVTYSDYEIYISSVQNGGTTINTTSGSRTGLFGNQGWAGYDRYNDGIYDYTEQGTGQVVSYTYNITGGNITSDVTFFFSGFAMNMPIVRNPGGISQGYVLHTTPGVVVGGTGERCDDGNLIDGDGCSSVCDQELPSCNWFTTTSQTGNMPHNFTISVLPNIYTGGYTFNQIQWMVGVIGSATGDVFTDNTYTYTGAGSYTARVRVSAPVGPQAQVGSTLNCSRPVTAISSCGNVVLEGNEQCDDGNQNNNDGCSAQCTFEIPQTCGLSGNLVPNPGFESYTQCTTSYGQFNGYTASWYSPSGDPDYGRLGCAYGAAMFNYIQQSPHLASSGMVNILTYASNTPNAGREYVGAELTTPMQIGNYYDVGFCFATHAASNNITDRIGMLFSTGAYPTNIGWNAIVQTPQFEHIGYAQGSGWTCVSGTVYADQSYERFLIGSFHTNTGQNMIPNPIYQTGLGPQGYEVANYVIDDVFVSEKCATCGDGLQAQSEQCDLGTGNTASCTPGYGQTCNYCSLSCTTGTQTGAYCGDTIVSANDGEQCDDGNQNNTDSCTNSCQRATPTCTLLLTPSAGSYPLNVLFSLNMNAGSSLIHMNYGDGTTGTSVTGHTYTTGGLFTPIAYIQNSSNTGLTAICPANTVITVVNGYTPVCGNAIIDTGANEVCDLGTGNTTSCTPAYGQSCSYCSLTCQVGTGQGPYCGDNIKNGNEECDGGSGCRTNCTKSSGGGTSGPTKDRCDGKDESPSYYDGKCTGTPKHTAAPVGRACKYEDEQYLTRGPFTDTYTHRALPYTEMMRASCMWRGRDTDEGQWHANPNENITVAEVLKTFVKVEGVAFDDFDIKTENARYPKPTPFADIPQDHWFAWYADYAVKKGLTDGLVTTKDGKKYLDPDRHITRNDAVKLMMITYDTINKKKISINGQSVLGDVVNASDPYYQYIRRAEALGFISGVKQKDGSYRFDGKRAITRAEFAKIVSVPFNDQLFDTSSLVLNSPVYTAIVRALDRVQGDKIDFMNTLLLNMARIPDTQFIRNFKVTKALFIQELRNAILPGLYEDASD